MIAQVHDWDDSVDDPRSGVETDSPELLDQVNKRLTLNLLIQGAAMHSFLTAHHLVRDELEALRPGLTRCYDRWAACLALSSFIDDIMIFCGLPSWFWRRISKPTSPFHRHRLLTEYGPELWRAAKRHLFARAWEKRVLPIPILHALQMNLLYFRTARLERKHRDELARLAEEVNAQVWGIDASRLDAKVTWDVAFGRLRKPKTLVGRIVQVAAAGYGGVVRRDGQFIVVAKSFTLPLVLHELTKGTVELICLHGLNRLDADSYEHVMDQADQIEFEPWMMQAGPELWRRLLAAMPEAQNLPVTLMHIARLDPQPLEDLMIAIAAKSPSATRMLAGLA